MSDMNQKNIPAGLYIMIGLIFLGLMLPDSISKLKSFDNTVSVKGLCEKEIMADKAIWPIRFKVGENNLDKLYEQIERQTKTVKEFLQEGGIDASEITTAPVKIIDKYTLEYSSSNDGYGFRYIATCTITVCTDKVSQVLDLMSHQSVLISRQVPLTTDWDCNPSFNFEGLNDIKPAMIEEATKNARDVAQKFADDSDSRLGRIKNATQGTFSIENRDENTPSVKKVRVVTYVTYYLK